MSQITKNYTYIPHLKGAKYMIPKSAPAPKQAIFIKAFHSINLLALIFMTASGLQIYNANPVFGGRAGWRFLKEILLGGWLGAGRNWHFGSM